MSLLAGYDFVLEISNATLLKLIKANFKIQGTPANPPFELSLPITEAGISGMVHLIANDMKIKLHADDKATLTLIFSNTSINLTSPVTITMSKLTGSIAIKAPLSIVSAGSSNQKSLGIDMTNAAVQLSFTPAVVTAIMNQLGALNFAYNQLINVANTNLENYIHKLGVIAFPLGFPVKAGVDGSLTQFEKLEVHCIENQNPAKEALGFFGIILAANHNNGNHAQKTTTAITGTHDIALSISPEIFRKVLLCPMMAKFLLPTEYSQDPTGTINKMPTACGTAGGVKTQGVTITKLTDSFASGHINLDVSCKKSGTCYDAKGSVHGELTLTANGSTIKPNITTQQPIIDVSIPWYCKLAAFAGIPFGLEITIILDSVMDSVLSDMADEIIKGMFKTGLPSFSTAKIPDVSFYDVKILQEGLILLGSMNINLPDPIKAGIKIMGSVQNLLSTKVDSGTVTSCQYNTYTYKEYASLQKGTYSAVATLMGKPLDLKWSITAGSVSGFGVPKSISEPVSFSGQQGTIDLGEVETHTPFPLPAGTPVTKNVKIDYKISGNTIKLFNRTEDNNYFFWLEVTAKDPMNNQAKYEIQGMFEGDEVEVDSGYYDDEAECLDILNQKLKELSLMYNDPIIDLLPRDHPDPDQLLGLVYQIIQTGDPAADDIISRLQLFHGHSFFRAMGSMDAVRKVAEKRSRIIGR